MYDPKELSWRTTFTNYKRKLINLLNEINEDEFNNKGIIITDARIDILRGISQDCYSMRNIILYFIAQRVQVGFHSSNFIGLFEAVNSQIGVYVSKDKSRYWISSISTIIETLLIAMDFW